MNLSLKKLLFVFSIVGAILLSACSNDEAAEEQNNDTGTANGDTENYGEAIDYTITGIEPGAGISVKTEEAIEEYDSLQGWNVDFSSTGALMTQLQQAIDNEEPIIITGWNPHWMFAQYPDMKYLDDPKEIYGGEEGIYSFARHGFEEDHPEAFKLIEQFEWEVEDMEEVMFTANETGKEIEEVGRQWAQENEEKTSAWVEGVEDVDGVEIEIASTTQDTERASAGVLQEVMEQKGFDVTVTPVDVPIVYETIANGDADATVAAWLPITQIEFYERYKDDMVELGANLTGAKIGLVVPEYMDIDSIEDLEPNQ
jgi:glycine betaine/proline transport system substrate-binding protein